MAKKRDRKERNGNARAGSCLSLRLVGCVVILTSSSSELWVASRSFIHHTRHYHPIYSIQ